MRSRVRFPALPWEFSLKGKIPPVTMVWVDKLNLGLRPLLALRPPISPLTHHRDNVTAPHGRPNLRVGYISAMPRRQDHEVHKGHVVALGGGGKQTEATYKAILQNI